jgi:hypothetical protein
MEPERTVECSAAALVQPWLRSAMRSLSIGWPTCQGESKESLLQHEVLAVHPFAVQHEAVDFAEVADVFEGVVRNQH